MQIKNLFISKKDTYQYEIHMYMITYTHVHIYVQYNTHTLKFHLHKQKYKILWKKFIKFPILTKHVKISSAFAFMWRYGINRHGDNYALKRSTHKKHSTCKCTCIVVSLRWIYNKIPINIIKNIFFLHLLTSPWISKVSLFHLFLKKKIKVVLINKLQ